MMMARNSRPRWIEIARFAEAAAALSVASLVIAVLPFRVLVRSMGHDIGEPKVAANEAAAPIRLAVMRASRRLPWRIRCFQKGLAAHWMLRLRGYPSRLHYGLKQEDGKLTAHVWVTLDGEIVTGEERGRPHAPVAVFPAGENRA